jgi:hypothetical protein
MVKPGNRLELGVGGPLIEGEEVFVAGTAVLGSRDEITPDDGQ